MDSPENTEGSIKNGQSGETGTIGYTRQRKTNKNTTQYRLDTTLINNLNLKYMYKY
jgi:hypothetical protein